MDRSERLGWTSQPSFHDNMANAAEPFKHLWEEEEENKKLKSSRATE